MNISIEKGKMLIIILRSVGGLSESTTSREVWFEVNGELRATTVTDRGAAVGKVTREKASSDPGSVGAPMSGVVVDIRVKEGQEVLKGDVLCVQSAMKVRLLFPVAIGVADWRFIDGECSVCPSFWCHQAGVRPVERLDQSRRSRCRDWSNRRFRSSSCYWNYPVDFFVKDERNDYSMLVWARRVLKISGGKRRRARMYCTTR